MLKIHVSKVYELDTWYKEDYPFWLKLQREMGYEVQ